MGGNISLKGEDIIEKIGLSSQEDCGNSITISHEQESEPTMGGLTETGQLDSECIQSESHCSILPTPVPTSVQCKAIISEDVHAYAYLKARINPWPWRHLIKDKKEEDAPHQSQSSHSQFQ